jgi:hypothetical protein
MVESYEPENLFLDCSHKKFLDQNMIINIDNTNNRFSLLYNNRLP